MSLVDYGVAALGYEVTPHPPKQDGTKRPQPEPIFDRAGDPVLKPDGSGEQAWGWVHRQTIRPTEAEVRRSFSRPRVTGFGIMCGGVSGPLLPLGDDLIGPPAPLSLEMLEFEDRGRFDE